MSRPTLAHVALMVALLGGGCAEFSDSGKTINYSTNAKENYDRGLGELKSENWLEAIRFFQFTRSKFGFSKWATLAELGIADAHFGQEKYGEAIDAYRNFIKAHPTHESVQNGYAAFRIGESFFKEIPSDWFLSPPAYEKDQGSVRDTLRELSAFLEEYPDSPFSSKGRKLLDQCIERLTAHELYVAKFYLDRDKPQAAIGRLEGLIKQFPNSSVEPQLLLMLGKTYLKMEKPVEAKRTFEKIVAHHPRNLNAEKAKLYLEFIARRYGAKADGSG